MNPKNHAVAALFATVASVTVSASLVAHHGTNISYDRSKPVTFTGAVTEFRLGRLGDSKGPRAGGYGPRT